MQNNDPQLNNTAAKKAGLNNRPGGLGLIINKFSLFRKHNKFPLGDVRKERRSVFFTRNFLCEDFLFIQWPNRNNKE